MREFKPQLRSTAAGGLPHTDPKAACDLTLETLAIPTWPQLPNRSFLENMYVQFSEGFPGVVVSEEQIYVDRERDLDAELERLYVAYLVDDVEFAAITAQYAAGLHQFLEMDLRQVPLVKGQITGPISWGFMVSDDKRQPVLYDDVLAEAIGKHLRLKASWMEKQLRGQTDHTLICIDEPYMSSFGSAFLSLSRAQAIDLLEEVFAGIEGLKGAHCCGNTDWSLLLSTSVDVLSLDAYGYAETLASFAEEIAAFVERGGAIAWGIVPATDQIVEETVESLMERFYAALGVLTARGLHQDDLLASALIMPSCGCGSLELELAERVIKTTRDLSQALQERHG
jgi:hypothetical protein